LDEKLSKLQNFEENKNVRHFTGMKELAVIFNYAVAVFLTNFY